MGGNILKNIFNNRTIEPYLYCSYSIITEVNQQFLDFTGYALDELLGKSLIEIGEMLKINSQILLDNIRSKYSGYIFTKFLSAREVNISLFHDTKGNSKKYIFVEKINSRLDDKLIFVEQTFVDEISGAAVYSVPDLILLKGNQKYFEFMDHPFNKEQNSIGRPIKEIITGFIGSQSEVVWNTVFVSQKASYTKEFEFNNLARNLTYWDFTKIPIFENGKMKYIFETSIEVTKRVFENKNLEKKNRIIKQQKQQLEQQNIQLEQHNTQLMSIIDNLSEGVMFADNKGKFIMVNAEANRLVYQSDIGITLDDAYKNTKAFDMKGNEIPFENFPSVRALRGERVKNSKIFVRHPNKEYFAEISSIPIYNASGELTMIVSCFHDITETIKQSRKIEEQKKELEAIIENISDSIAILIIKNNIY